MVGGSDERRILTKPAPVEEDRREETKKCQQKRQAQNYVMGGHLLGAMFTTPISNRGWT